MRALAFLVFILSLNAWADLSSQLKFQIQNNLKINAGWSELAAIIYQAEENQEYTTEQIYSAFSALNPQFKKLDQQSQYYFLSIQKNLFPHTKNLQTRNLWIKKINSEGLSIQTALTLASDANLNNFFPDLTPTNQELVENAKNKIEVANAFSPLTPEQLFDLYDFDASTRGLKIMVFCRHSRNYPCRMIVKDRLNQLSQDDEAKTWSLPVLAKSRRGLAFNVRNGQTPQGMHDIDAVMPYADQVVSFGKYRRLKLEFFSNTNQESASLNLLPESVKDLDFWKQANIARDVGRSSLRVHGTGKINQEPETTFYPHMPTAGCISTREGKYADISYKDQRLLLDHLMQSLDLLPEFSHETSIRGTLYLIELDQKEAAVSLQDLKDWGLPVIL